MVRVSVSVIVPVYNAQDYLAKCIDSVLSQTYEDFELILVNDGSKDGSPEICDRYQQMDSRIKVIHKANEGPSATRNVGLDITEGKYICFLDSDDYIEPDLLEKTVAIMEQRQCDCVAYGMIRENVQGVHLENIAYKPVDIKIATEEERMNFLLKYLLNYRVGWEVWNRVFRGDIIRDNKLRFLHDVAYAEDMLFSFRYMLYANSCVVLPDCPYHYVQHSDSLMGQSKFRNVLPQMCVLAQEAYRSVEKANLPLVLRDFPMIYLHLLEWQTRPYVAEKGIGWVKEELAKLPFNEFWPVDAAQQRQLYQELMMRYGDIDGAVTVVIPILTKAELPQAENYIEKLLGQTLQKLDILILSKEALQPNTRNIRVRWEQVENLDAEGIVCTAFEKAYGENIYFADCSDELPVDFCERMADVMKYNACGTVILTEEQPMFVDRDSVYDRIKFRQLMGMQKFFRGKAMIRRDLLEESGIAPMGHLARYMADVLLSNHVLLIR